MPVRGAPALGSFSPITAYRGRFAALTHLYPKFLVQTRPLIFKMCYFPFKVAIGIVDAHWKPDPPRNKVLPSSLTALIAIMFLVHFSPLINLILPLLPS